MNLVYFLSQRLFRLLGRAFFDLTVIGADNAKFDGPALITSNHVSYLDPPLIGAIMPQAIHYLARTTLSRKAVAAWFFKHWHVISVDREKPDPSTFKSIFRSLAEGNKLIVFPEGTRSPDGELQASEPGVGMMIAKADVPVLPVRIFGAFEALPRDRKFPRKGRITISFGKPWVCDVDSFGKGKEAYQRIADEVMRRISELPER